MSGQSWLSARIYRERIAAADDHIRAFVALAPDAQRPRSYGALDGLAMAIKANIAVAGLPWTAGIAAYRHRIAEVDAGCVADLRKAGAIILGLTNMDEGALGALTDNPWSGQTQNPWRDGFTAGGSSGGSAAAVAAGLCGAALGTDTFGSVRIPAAYTGQFGLKPAYGTIPSNGVIPLARRFDHVGVIAASARLCGLVFRTIGAEHFDKITDTPVVGRIADADDPVASALLTQQIVQAGLTVEYIELPPDYDHATLIRPSLLIAKTEASRYHRQAMADHGDAIGATFCALLEWGERQSPERIASAHGAIDTAKASAEHALAEIDVLLSPAVPGPAHSFSSRSAIDPSRYTLLASILGWAAVVFPIGLGPDGLPRAGQAMARTSAEALGMAERLALDLGPPFGFASQEIS